MGDRGRGRGRGVHLQTTGRAGGAFSGAQMLAMALGRGARLTPSSGHAGSAPRTSSSNQTTSPDQRPVKRPEVLQADGIAVPVADPECICGNQVDLREPFSHMY